MPRRFAAVFCWAYLTWALLTWTLTVEQVVCGIAVSALVAAACLPLGPMAGPWSALRPRRAWALLRLGTLVLVRMVRANLWLSRRIWARHPRTPSGMVILPTVAASDGALAAVGVLTSVIVDSQLVDLDRGAAQLQYHLVDVGRRGDVNGPVERALKGITS